MAATPRRIGLIGEPFTTSGPDAQKAPIKAITIPTNCNLLGRSPFIKAIVIGISAPSDPIDETTPMVPVANPW